jgi:glycosyltransferase involved in cell wall biosynthesis
MKQPRVLFVAPQWPPGRRQNGIVTYIGNIRHALQAEGIVSQVLAFGNQATEVQHDVHDAERMSSLALSAVRTARRLLRRVAPRLGSSIRATHELVAALALVHRRFAFDLIEIEESFGHSYDVQRLLPWPVVVRLHGPWFLNGAALGVKQDAPFEERVATEGRAIRAARWLSAPSRDVLERTSIRYGADLRHGVVIPNPGPVVPEAEVWNPGNAEPGRVLFVGRFDRHKGGDLVIDAFARVAQTDDRAKLIFIGPDHGLVEDGETRVDLNAYLTSRVPDLRVRERIVVTGAQPASTIVAERLKAAVTVVASRYENFPMTVVEAMAHGTPMIVSGAGGILELARDGQNALVFQSENVDDLARALTNALQQPALCADLARGSRRDYLAKFCPQVVGKSAADYYRSVVR